MKIFFTELANQELNDATAFYESELPAKPLYSIEQDHILVIAVSHQHRKPDYWINRL